MYQQIHRLDSERWLQAQFPHREWLLADIDRAITECPAPLDTVGADPRRFGHTVEMAIALDLCTYFPYSVPFENLAAWPDVRFVRRRGGLPRVFRTVLLACYHAANVSSVRPLRTSNGVL